MKTAKKILLFILPLVFISGSLFAQGCALCSVNAKSMGAKAGVGLNNGILYLAAVPVVAVIIVGGIWFRQRHSLKSEQD